MRDAAVLLETLRLSPQMDASALAAGWARADAAALVGLAIREGAGVWLSRRLTALRIHLDGEGDAATALSSAARRGVAQSLRVDAEAVATLDLLASVGVDAVPLKSAAMRRIADRVPYADARTPNDVDILVPHSHAQRAFDAMRARGYRVPKETVPPGHHHLPALAGALGIGVELHFSTSPSVEPAEAWRRATHDGATALVGGTARPIPSDTELLWHAASHAVSDTVDYARVGTRLRYWLDVSALLAARVDIDWLRLRARLESGEVLHAEAVRAWLRSAAWLAGVVLPSGAVGGTEGSMFDVERMVHWRLHVHAKHPNGGRWAERLVEEGARGEAGLGVEPGHFDALLPARIRHAVAASAARVVWRLGR